ncbi:MAG: site-specific DNA-methyltransferase [Selenomonadaceae bacterium]|nr:site-specific DNA-methyltransferase [Selenomonadaceae bacterium]
MLEKNKIYNIDCIEGMRLLQNSSIDLTVTSPPYDNLRSYKGYSFDFESVAKELYRVTKDGGVVVWVVNDATVKGSETGTSFRQALYFKEVGFLLHDTMLYEKDSCPYPETTRYYPSFEYMFILVKGKIGTVHLIADKPNKHYGDKISGTVRNPDGSVIPMSAIKNNTGRKIKPFGIRPNIWRYKMGYMKSTTDKISYKHPAIFPEQLAYDHIISWSNKGDVVLDPFMGSGTTAKMARVAGRDFIGFEISKEYCDIAEERLNTNALFF